MLQNIFFLELDFKVHFEMKHKAALHTHNLDQEFWV